MAALVVAMPRIIIDFPIFTLMHDYCDVEKTDSNTATCCGAVAFIKVTCGSLKYCEMWNRTAMYCLWFVKEFTECILLFDRILRREKKEQCFK